MDPAEYLSWSSSSRMSVLSPFDMYMGYISLGEKSMRVELGRSIVRLPSEQFRIQISNTDESEWKRQGKANVLFG